MDITLPAFTPVQESLYLTLCGRALDYRSPRPILGDAMADEIVRNLHYDCARFRLSASPIINIALRASVRAPLQPVERVDPPLERPPRLRPVLDAKLEVRCPRRRVAGGQRKLEPSKSSEPDYYPRWH